MINTSIMDAQAFYEKYVMVVGRPTTSRCDGKEYHGSCPWCGGTDRFAFWDSGRYSCSLRASGCGRAGRDVIDFLREYAGLTFLEACDELGLDAGSEYTSHPTSSPPPTDGEPPSRTWQERAAAVVHQGQKILWSGRGRAALQYLRGRGFTDETIRGAHLGYIPLTGEGRWVRDSLVSWGLSSADDPDACLWLPEGLLIPWFADERLWKLTVRRLCGLKAGDAKYVQVKGSGEGLYNVDALGAGVPLVVCESELDTLSGQQTCADLAAFVATGATTRARRACWLERMKRAPWVLIAYDDDLPGSSGTRAGDAGAAYWVRTLPQAIRWTPWAHDVNEMLQGGQDLRRWVELGRAVALVERPSVEYPSRSVQEGAARGDAGDEGWRDGDQPRDEPSRKEAGALAPSASWPIISSDELLPVDGPQEEPTRTQARLQGVTRVSTPLGPGMLFQETPLAEQLRRGRLGVMLDDSLHGGRRLTYFVPPEIALYRPQTAYWAHCPTEVALPGHPQHSGVPAWLSPDTRDYAELVKRVGREEAMARRAIFWRGFPDVLGNRWCGQCFWQQCLIESGEHLGYPAMEGVEAGYEAWLQLARYGGSLRVQEGAHRAKRLLHDRSTPKEADRDTSSPGEDAA
jgi:DNA primase